MHIENYNYLKINNFILRNIYEKYDYYLANNEESRIINV